MGGGLTILGNIFFSTFLNKTLIKWLGPPNYHLKTKLFFQVPPPRRPCPKFTRSQLKLLLTSDSPFAALRPPKDCLYRSQQVLWGKVVYYFIFPTKLVA